MDWVWDHASAIGSFIGGIIAGAFGGSLLTLKIFGRSASGHSNITDQRRATAAGDIVGRDKRNS